MFSDTPLNPQPSRVKAWRTAQSGQSRVLGFPQQIGTHHATWVRTTYPWPLQVPHDTDPTPVQKAYAWGLYTKKGMTWSAPVFL